MINNSAFTGKWGELVNQLKTFQRLKLVLGRIYSSQLLYPTVTERSCCEYSRFIVLFKPIGSDLSG